MFTKNKRKKCEWFPFRLFIELICWTLFQSRQTKQRSDNGEQRRQQQQKKYYLIGNISFWLFIVWNQLGNILAIIDSQIMRPFGTEGATKELNGCSFRMLDRVGRSCVPFVLSYWRFCCWRNKRIWNCIYVNGSFGQLSSLNSRGVMFRYDAIGAILGFTDCRLNRLSRLN